MAKVFSSFGESSTPASSGDGGIKINAKPLAPHGTGAEGHYGSSIPGSMEKQGGPEKTKSVGKESDGGRSKKSSFGSKK